MSTFLSGVNLVVHGADDILRVTETDGQGAYKTYFTVEVEETADGRAPGAVLATLPSMHWGLSMYVGNRSVVFYTPDSLRLVVVAFASLHSVVERSNRSSSSSPSFLHAEHFNRPEGAYSELDLFTLKEDFAITRAKQLSNRSRGSVEELQIEPEACFTVCASGPAAIALLAASNELRRGWNAALTRIACDFETDSQMSHADGMRVVPLVEIDRRTVVDTDQGGATTHVAPTYDHERYRSIIATLQPAAAGPLRVSTDLGSVFLRPAATASAAKSKDLSAPQETVAWDRAPRDRVSVQTPAVAPAVAAEAVNTAMSLSGIVVSCTQCGAKIAIERRAEHAGQCTVRS